MMNGLLPFFALIVVLPPLVAQRQDSPPSKVETPNVEKTEYDMRALTVQPALSGVQLKGKKLLGQRCSVCHVRPEATVVMDGPELNAETVERLGEGPARDAILKGSPRMPGFQYTLQPADADSIIAYLKTVKKQWYEK